MREWFDAIRDDWTTSWGPYPNPVGECVWPCVYVFVMHVIIFFTWPVHF